MAQNSWIHEYQIVGRKMPSELQPEPPIFRMRIFAKDSVKAKSRFWYFLSKYHKMKKTTGEILSVNEIFENRPQKLKNFAIWARYESRSGTHNLYKEFRDITRTGAVQQFYLDMAGRHRVRSKSAQIIQVQEISSTACKRPNMQEFFNSSIKFPLPHRVQRTTDSSYKKRFRSTRPSTVF
eukprot:TRINITY_DN136622_c0_g1_i1.p1 TRINITY_DN136622_c0_g1~~TRINITY_DN136622_c0_g1_i1.p1  ORF type:complete len:189 (-),score=27.06 TRINITY_DN136622_c0_g1_i1:75-614(-)